MTPSFDKDYWESHWQDTGGSGAGQEIDPNPHLVRETRGLVPGTALDAGCGEGAEAIFLATAGWQVTAADISGEVLRRAAERARKSGAPPERLQWFEADLSTWEPGARFDLVTTHYAHPAMPQLSFYERLAEWVAPGGTLLIVGHRHTLETAPAGRDHGHHPPAEASVTVAGITARLEPDRWDVVTAEEPIRTPPGRSVPLADVVVRATRHL